ncbi:MAG: NAD(P)-dependent oxidoreductase, partial [Rikenellaceae bacterium]
MKRVLVTYNMLREGYKELCEKYDVTFPPDGVEAFSYDEVAEIIDQYDALQPMFNFKVDKKLLDAGKKLKIVSNYAVGYDNIDVDHATKLGIQVTNTPGAVTAPTADLALGLMIDVCRKMSEVDRKLRNNTIKVELLGNLGQSLSGRTLGIIGMGRIGKALARRAIACDMKIVYYNRNRVEQNVEEALNAKYLSLDELLKEADIVSINAPYTPQTHHIIGE